MEKLIKIIQTLTFIFAIATCVYEGAAAEIKVEVSGQGAPMILIPGLTCPGAVWDETVTHYQSEYECHVISLPGFGGEDPISLENGFIPTMKDEIANYITQNNLKNITYIGHSLGGFIGLWLASENDIRFNQLVIVDSLPFLSAMMVPTATEESAKQMATGISQQAATQSPEQTRMMLSSLITSPEGIETAFKWGKESDPATVQKAMYELYTTDLRDDVAQISTPTLVLGAWVGYKNWGATRESTSAIYDLQYKQHPNYTLKMTDVGRHFIMWDDSEFFFTEVDAFLTQ